MDEYKKYYKEYIVSEEWFLKRKQAFKFYGRKCQRCLFEKKLHVHHKTYDNFRNEIIEKDLAILCDKCHTEYHKKYKHASIETTDLFIVHKKTKNIVLKKQKNDKNKKERKLLSGKLKKGKIAKTEIHNPFLVQRVEYLSI